MEHLSIRHGITDTTNISGQRLSGFECIECHSIFDEPTRFAQHFAVRLSNLIFPAVAAVLGDNHLPSI